MKTNEYGVDRNGVLNRMRWFERIKNMVIPDGVTEIGSNAFYLCNNLISVTIPDGVTKINEYAFAKCSNLTEVVIPNSVTTIGEYAFMDCKNLERVVISEGTTQIEKNVFAGCEKLDGIVIPKSVSVIGENAFRGCASLTSITFSDNIVSIESHAFEGCSNLSSVQFLGKLEKIEPFTFAGCSKLQKFVVPSGCIKIGCRAFYGSGLQTVFIPRTVKVLERQSFCCSKLFAALPVSLEGIMNKKVKRKCYDDYGRWEEEMDYSVACDVFERETCKHNGSVLVYYDDNYRVVKQVVVK